MTKYRDQFIDEHMRLEDEKKLSENADPKELISKLSFSRDLLKTAEKCKEKRKCPTCGFISRMNCHRCSTCLLEEGVLPSIDLPADLIV